MCDDCISEFNKTHKVYSLLIFVTETNKTAKILNDL